MERLANGRKSYLFKDFAHAPSKVKATTQAVKEQFPDSKLVACLELHTYSSLDPSFIVHYRNSLEKADLPIVFYDPEALKIKNRPPISPEEILVAFDLPELMVFTEPQKLKDHLLELDYHQKVLLMMSSGNYGGLDWEALKFKLSHY